MVLRFYTKKSQVISTKNEGVTAIFPNFDFILNWENQCHAFIFAQNDLNFLCNILEPQHKKIQVILSKNEGVTLIFPIQNEIKIWKNSRHAFIFDQNDLKFLCEILEPQHKKKYKIAIVKFCLYIVLNCNQSHANFQFFKV